MPPGNESSRYEAVQALKTALERIVEGPDFYNSAAVVRIGDDWEGNLTAFPAVLITALDSRGADDSVNRYMERLRFTVSIVDQQRLPTQEDRERVSSRLIDDVKHALLRDRTLGGQVLCVRVDGTTKYPAHGEEDPWLGGGVTGEIQYRHWATSPYETP